MVFWNAPGKLVCALTVKINEYLFQQSGGGGSICDDEGVRFNAHVWWWSISFSGTHNTFVFVFMDKIWVIWVMRTVESWDTASSHTRIIRTSFLVTFSPFDSARLLRHTRKFRNSHYCICTIPFTVCISGSNFSFQGHNTFLTHFLFSWLRSNLLEAFN